MKGWISGFVVAAFLTACGGGSTSPQLEASPETTSTSATPEEVIYLEPDDCRKQMSTVEQVVDSMQRDSLSFSTFQAQVERIDRLADRAETTCSRQVMLPLRMALYKWSLANFTWTLCDQGTKCEIGRIEKDIRAGIDRGRRAVAQASRQ